MVIAHHLIWTAYGWWLPNDLRGSMSKTIESDVIAELGALHYGRKKVQPASRDIRAFYQRAEEKLKFTLESFDPVAVSLLSTAFRMTIQKFEYTCYASAIMPDHVHMVIRKHKHLAEEMIDNFQSDSRRSLLDANLRETNHPVWGGPGWKVFLDEPDDVWRTIPYVENNPIKIYQPKQVWEFVTKYDGWPFHRGSRM